MNTTLLPIKDEETTKQYDNSISKTEGYKNIAGWLCYKAPKLSKLGKRKLELQESDEPGFCKSAWLDLKNVAICSDNSVKAGGLKYARETLVEDVETMDLMFKEHHSSSSDGLLRTNNVIGKVIIHKSHSAQSNFYGTEIEIWAGFWLVGNTEKK